MLFEKVFAKNDFKWLRSSTCLVTGGAGFIGSNLTSALLEIGAKVRVLDNFDTGLESNLKGKKVDLLKDSVLNADKNGDWLSGVDHVFHLAAAPAVPRSIAHPLETFYSNVVGTQLLLEAARAKKVKSFVFSSSSSIYGGITEPVARREMDRCAPLSPYAAQKLSSESLCVVYGKSMGVNTASLRYFNIFGPGQNPKSSYAAVIPLFIKAALEGKEITIFGDGTQKRDFTFVSNAVYANLLATDPSKKFFGEIFNVGCGNSYSLNQLTDHLQKKVGGKLKIRKAEPRAGDVYFSLADLSKSKSGLGYEPLVDFYAGLDLTFDSLAG